MTEFFAVLPLAFVMIAGPQIISSVFLATSEGWGRNPLAFLAGAAMSIAAFVTIAYLVAKGAKGGSSEKSSGGEGVTLDLIILALLGFLAVRRLGRRRDRHAATRPVAFSITAAICRAPRLALASTQARAARSALGARVVAA